MTLRDILRRLPRPAVAAVLVIVVTGYVLAGVAANRRPPADAAANLTERELPIGWQGEEDTGIELRLNWREAVVGGTTDWLNQAKLTTLGFEFPVPLDDEGAEVYYDDFLPRRAYGVLEYEGEAWRAHLEQQKKELAELRDKIRRRKATPDEEKIMLRNQASDRIAGTRLFLVDLGLDSVALRQANADRRRFIVTPVLVSASYYKPWDYERNVAEPAKISGSAQVLGTTIHVPRSKRAILDEVRRADEARRLSWEEQRQKMEKNPKHHSDANGWFDPTRPPAYAVALPFGRRLEPWVESISVLQMPQVGSTPVTAPATRREPLAEGVE